MKLYDAIYGCYLLRIKCVMISQEPMMRDGLKFNWFWFFGLNRIKNRTSKLLRFLDW
jgi:hypothetical protein